MMGFQFGMKDAIDILLVGLILYEVFRLLRKSGAVNLFWGIFTFLIAWFLVSYVFQLDLTGALFDRIISVGAIALIVIFQEEIRSFFYSLGARFSTFHIKHHGRANRPKDIAQIVLACEHMSHTKTGALIILSKRQALKEYTDTGEYLDSIISARTIENIFFKNTPLHDGALFIMNGRLCSAACILPVSKNQDLPQHYGLRHRAALGLTEKTDAVAIVVSEETGLISLAQGDHITTITPIELKQYLIDQL